mmetsp:Transcript_107036/g.301173  ORF Transcript_107036/g.301173 Transcript_107036/m.301173 type:complete len:445 (-) Transcript_107036:103-1437(-)
MSRGEEWQVLPSGEEAPRRCGVVAGHVLWLRACDGFSRNMLYANQIDLFQRLAGLGESDALRAASFLSAVSSLLPLVIGILVTSCAIRPRIVACVGGVLECLGLATVAIAMAHILDPSLGRLLAAVGVFGVYSLGFSFLTSTLPVYGRLAAGVEGRAEFMQHFFAALACGSIVGIMAAGVCQVDDDYTQGFMAAVVVLALGLAGLLAGAARCGGPEDTHGDCAARRGDMQGIFPNLWPLLALLPFYAAYFQWTTTWYVQAEFMNRTWVGGAIVPNDALQVVERIAAIVSLFALPQIWKLPRFGGAPTPLRRLALGSVIAAVALAVSGVLEVARKGRVQAAQSDGQSSSLHVAWLVPQYAIIGLAEAIVFPAQTEWASGSAAIVGLGVAIHASASCGLGFALPYLRDWLPQASPNRGHYELYFFSIAASCVVAALPLAWATPREH